MPLTTQVAGPGDYRSYFSVYSFWFRTLPRQRAARRSRLSKYPHWTGVFCVARSAGPV